MIKAPPTAASKEVQPWLQRTGLTEQGFHGGSEGKESACSAGDPGSIPGSARSPEEGNGNPLQYSILDNTMDRGAWRAIVLWYNPMYRRWGHKESDMTEWLTLSLALWS